MVYNIIYYFDTCDNRDVIFKAFLTKCIEFHSFHACAAKFLIAIPIFSNVSNVYIHILVMIWTSCIAILVEICVKYVSIYSVQSFFCQST